MESEKEKEAARKLVKRKAALRKIKRIYIIIAIILLNTLVLLLLINITLHFLNPTLRKIFIVTETTYNDQLLDEIYPNIKSHDIQRQIVEENSAKDLQFIYDSFTGFRTKDFNGTFVKVDKAGYRYIKDQCQYPPSEKNYNIYFLGGSTTFGSGLMDNETIPSKLQEKLRAKFNRTDICVYNFARPHYYSSTERALLMKLIVEMRQAPNMTIFVDGLNEQNGEQVAYEDKLTALSLGTGKLGYLFSGTALATVVNHLYNQFIANPEAENIMRNESRMLERYLENQKIIRNTANIYNISAYFVLQPIPGYKYDCSSQFLCKRGLLDYNGTKWIVSRGFYSTIENSSLTTKKSIIYLGNIQENKKKNLYVDFAHYTADFSDELADRIINGITTSPTNSYIRALSTRIE